MVKQSKTTCNYIGVDGKWLEISHEQLERLKIELFKDGSGAFAFGDEHDYYYNLEGFSRTTLPYVIELLEEFITEAKKRLT